MGENRCKLPMRRIGQEARRTRPQTPMLFFKGMVHWAGCTVHTAKELENFQNLLKSPKNAQICRVVPPLLFSIQVGCLLHGACFMVIA